MEKAEILKHIDHTMLKTVATWADIVAVCQEAVLYKTASVCIPPCYVKRVRLAYSDLNICTVIGFPLGYYETDVKVFEAKKAVADGANEIDMVVNMTDVKNGLFKQVEGEIALMKQAIGNNILKVIVETCYLTKDEKIALCQAVTNGKGDYIKTSTGFGSGGATIEDVVLFKKHIGKNVKIKAAGGIKSASDLVMFLEAGCDRIGTSAAIGLLKGEIGGSY